MFRSKRVQDTLLSHLDPMLSETARRRRVSRPGKFTCPSAAALSPVPPMKSLHLVSCSLVAVGLALGSTLLLGSQAFGVPLLPEGSHSLAPESEDALRTVTVTGKGEAEVSATRLEVRGKLRHRSEIASEAFEEFRELRRRSVEALGALEFEGLSVRGLGPVVSYSKPVDDELGGRIGLDLPEEMLEGGVLFEETLLLSVAGFDQLDAEARGWMLSDLIDESLDSGVELHGDAPNPLAMFWGGMNTEPKEEPEPLVSLHLEAEDEIRMTHAAYADAMARARTDASALARLSDSRLGPVLSVEVLESTTSWENSGSTNVCRTELRVRFELLP